MILISFPLKAELQFFMDAIKNDKHNLVEDNSKGPRVYISPAHGWILSYGGHGKTQFAIQTQHVIHMYPEINSVIVAGACGSLIDQLKIGDVVVATHTVEHDYKERFSPQPLPKFEVDQNLLEKFKSTSTKLHFGIIASGDEDVIESRRANELHEYTQAVAVAWEGAGGARVSKYFKLPFLEIRGVTDTANSNTMTDFKVNLKTSMLAIYTVLKTALIQK
jgi:adenosylhomocysteine nucleosidase